MRITRRQLLRLIREELEKVEEDEELEEEISAPSGKIPAAGDGTVRRRVDGKISRLDIEAKKQSPAARWD